MNDQSHSQLLSHIVSRWSNRTEDIAVDALEFILSRSRAARNALQGVVEAVAPSVGELTSARTQVSGSDGARPDLVVYGSDDRERVIVEAKFWAGLTENQPESYLARLPDDGETSVLLFVAPEARLETLWIELQRRTRHDAGVADRSEVGGVKCMPIDSGQRYLVLSSWRMVLDRMLTSAVATADPIEADIRQLQALCEREDSAAFLPIKPGEFAPAIPRRILQLNQLVDDVVARARERGFVKTDGLYATSQRYGYGRYIKLGTERADRWGGAWFGVHSELWAQYAETPLWLTFHSGGSWGENVLSVDSLRQRLGEDVWARTPNSIPVHLPTGVEYDAVLDSVVGYLCELANRIGGMSPSPRE